MRRLRDWSGSRGGKKGCSFYKTFSIVSLQYVYETYLTGLDGIPKLKQAEQGPLDRSDALLLVCIFSRECLHCNAGPVMSPVQV